MTLFPELREQERLANLLAKRVRVEELAVARHGAHAFPVMGFTLGSKDPKAPTLAFSGGVHGLERIGSQVALAFLGNVAGRLEWDEALHWQLERMRLVFMPLVNPIGMHLGWRANGNGVDLMRNSPVRAYPRATPWVGGQTVSPRLPWYMGNPDRMEVEAQALVDFMRRESFDSELSILVDCHSGFGMKDQLWFPFAKTHEPFPHIGEMMALKKLLRQVHPNHVYEIEPQAKNYVTHGDLWDHLFEEHAKLQKPGKMMLLTLEMGSWMWVRKNPFQLLSFLGAFNPVKPHRLKRALRRHLPLFDFLTRATHSHSVWSQLSEEQRMKNKEEALKLWYQAPLPK